MYFTPLNYNRRFTRLFFLFVTFFGIANFANAQTSTEFWFAPPELTQGHGGTGNIFVRLAAGDAGATVSIDMPANPGALNSGSPISVVLAANESQTVNLTSFINILETRPQATVLSTGLHITSTEEITAIYEAGPNNNVDIWALKGANGLGTEFYVPMQNLWPQGNYTPDPYTSFDIVATEDNTTILIFPTSDLDEPNGANGAAGGEPAFQSFTITLDAGETYSAAVTDRNNPENNPSGSIILSDKPIAVSIKDDSISPPGQGCREAVGDQIVPVDIVGNEYIVNKGGLNAGSGEYAYVIATANNTQISVDGVFETTLFNAETYPIQITNDLTYISGNKDFYLIHVSGFGCESGMAQLPPLNCAGSEQVSFVRSTTESFFINLLVPAGAEDAFVLNGGSLTIDPADFDVVPGTGGAWVGAQIQFSTAEIPTGQANLITNSEEVFSLGLINGGASSGCRFGYFSEFASEIIVDAGPDQTVCANRVTQLAGSVTGGATNGVWTTNGTGTFSDSSDFNAIYEPSLADLSAGTVTLTLTSVSNCFPVEDEVVITYTPAPVVVAGPDIEACENNTTVELNGFVDIATGGIWSGGAGTFSPTNGQLDAEYTPTLAEVTAGSVVLNLTTTGNGTCFAEEDSLEITFGPAPTADAGVDQILCGNNAEAQLLGAVTTAGGGIWSGGTGTFDPSNTSLSPVYTPSPTEILNGSVTLTLTTTSNGGCLPVDDQVTLTFTDAPEADAGSDRILCRNNADIVLDGAILVASGGTWSGGTGTFNPNANTLNATYTPSLAELLAGTVTLTLTTTGNGDCVAVTDNVTFTFTDAPVVNAGADANICSNNPDITLNGSLVGANFGIWSGGAGSFSPNITDLNAVYTPTPAEIAAGSLTLTLTSLDNGTCNPVTDEVTYTFTDAPTANAGPDQSVCENNADINLAGSVTIASGGQWSGGLGTFTPDANTLNAIYTPTASELFAGSITLTLTTTGNGTCSPVTDNVTITFTDAPTANAGVDQTLCSNNADISLAGSVTIATGGTWSGGLGIYTPNANDLNAVYSPTASEIASGSLTLTLTTTGNGTCNPVTDEVTITFSPSPVVEAGAPISVCSNNPQVSLNGSVTVAGGGTWSGGAGTFVPNANALNALYNPTPAEIAAGTLELTLTSTGNGTCNAESDVVTINFTASPTANAGIDRTVCANNPTVDLNGNVSLATGGQWSGGNGIFNPNNTSLGASYTPSAAEIAAGTVTLTLTTTGNGSCIAVDDAMTITITPAPVVEAGAGAVLCANNADITLNGSVTVASGATWSGGSGTFTPDASTLDAVYSPSATEIANGSVTLTLTSTGNGNCTPVSDNVTYTFSPAPTANAGADIEVCENNAAVSLNGAVTIAGGGVWSGGLGIFTPNANALNALYTPTAAEIAAGSLNLTLTTTGNGTCNPVTDEVEITFTDAPLVNAGVDQTVCANDPAVNLNGSVSIAAGGIWSGGGGVFSPNNTALGAVYTPSAAEIAAGSVTLTLTSTGNGDCNAVSDNVTITITPAPVVDAGPGFEVCGNNPNINLTGSVTIASGGTWTGGGGTFTPNANTLDAVYTPTLGEISSGSVTLTLTSTGNGNCLAVSDNVTYTFGDSPTVSAGPDQVLCENNAEVTLAGSFTIVGGIVWSGGAGTFSPSATNPNATYTPTAAELAAGSVTLTITTTGNGLCNAETDDVTITFTDAPIADAGVDQTVCGNDAEVNLSGSVSIATGGTWSGGFGSFSPSPNSLFATYTPSLGEIAAGTVTLTLTTTGNGNCSPVTDQIEITITDAPTASAGADATFCENNAEIALGGVVTVASGGIWSGGNGTFTPDVNTLNAVYTPSVGELNTGSVTLTLTTTGNGDCVAVSDAVTYTFTDAPTVNAGPDQTLCENNADVTLAGSFTISGGATWSGGAGTFSPSPNSTNAVYTPTAAELAAGSVTLTLTTTGNGTCNPESDDVTITFTDAPIANAGADQSVCANNPNVNLTGSVTNAIGGTWSGGFGTFSPDANSLFTTYTPSAGEIAAGTVTLTLTTTGIGNCNPVTDQITITITDAPTANAGADDTFCANNAEINLNGSVSIATGGTWSGGSGTFTPNANDLNAVYTPSQSEINNGSVTLTLTTTGNGNCTAANDQVTFTLTPAPNADAGADIDVCSNNAQVSLSGAVTVAAGGVWSGGAGAFSPSANNLNATYTPTAAEIAAGTLTLTLTTTGNGDCNAESDEVEITFTPSPTANAGADETVCANNPVVNLNGQVTVASGGTWSGGNGVFTPNNTTLGAVYTPSAAEIAAGSVTLTLTTTGNGDCNAVSDNILITITPAPVVNAGSDANFCANNSVIPLNGAVSVAGGGAWSGGSGTFSPDANTLNATYTPSAGEIASGSITLTLTSTGNGDCVAVTDQVTFTFSPAPTVDAGSDQDVCENNPEVSLSGAVTIASGGVWSGGAGTFNPSANNLNATYTPTPAEIAAGTLVLTLTSTGNGTCNPESDDVEITFTPAPTANAGLDAEVCANDPEVVLNGTVAIATGGVWSGGLGTFAPNNTTLGAVYTPSVAEVAAGSVTLTLTTTGNGNCSPVSDQKVITITPAPIVDAGVGFELCANNPDVALAGVVSVASGGTWTGGGGTFTPNANTLNAIYTPTLGEIASGSITLTLTSTGNGNCLAVSDNVTYTFGPAPTVSAGPDQTLCENNANVALAGAVTVASGGEWSGGAGTFTPNANALNAVYTPTAAELASGSITLTLTTTGNGNCNPVSDGVVINFTDAPTANAGLDQTVCGNDPEVNLSGSVSIATGGTWSGGFGTFSPDANSLFTTYTPGLGEIAAGSVTLTLTTTGNGNCTPVTDEITITITDAPTADAGPDASLCENNAEISLNGVITVATGASWTGGNGTFNPNPNTLDAVYTPSIGELTAGSVTLTLTTTGNGDCIAVSDAVTYTFTDAPTIDAGADQVLCENNANVSLSATLTGAGGVQWSGGAGTYSPSANALNITYIPTAAELTAGTVTLTATTTGNANCLPVSDDVQITFTDAPTANAGADQTVCANNPNVNLTGSVSIATGGTWSGGFGSFSPNANSLFATYTPSLGEIAAGSVTLTLTTTGNGNCTPVTDQITITITPEPTVDAGTGASFCANNAEIALNGSISVATGATWSGGSGTFTPNANALDATYTPSVSEITAGSVTLTLTSTGNGLCSPVTDNVTYTFTPAPTVNAGANITLCANNAQASLNGSVTVASGGVWSGGAGTFSPNANTLDATYTPTAAEIAAGTLTLTLTTTGNGDCIAESDEVDLIFTPAPTANAGADVEVCANDPNVNLNGQVTVVTGGIWTGGNGVFNPNNTTLGAVYTPSPAEIAAGTVTLTLTTTGNGNCSAVTDQMVITIAPAPIVDAGIGFELCENNPSIALAGSVANATGATWSGGSGTFVPNANTLDAVYTPSASEISNGSITLTLTSTGNGDCLPESDVVTYTFGPAPTADAGSDQTVCANNAEVSLSGSVTIATGGAWSGGSGTFSPNANTLSATYTPSAAEIAAGTVTLTLTTTGNGDCLPVSDNVVINFSPAPTASAGSDQTICANNAQVSLNGSVTIATGGTWSGGDGVFSDVNILNPTYTPSAAEIAAGSVTLTLTTTGNGNCNPVSDNLVINITPAPVVDAGTTDVFCSNNPEIALSGAVTGATGGTWSGGSGTFTPDANDLNAIYTPSAGEITAGSVTLVLTSTGNGNCLPVSDNVTYIFSPAPTADAGANQTVCANNADVSLSGSVTVATGGAWSGGMGTFTPNANALNATYAPSPADIAAGSVTLTLTTTGNGDCLPESDDVTITFTPAPTANAGMNVTVCANNADVNLNGSVTVATGGSWSGGTGTFTPDANTLNAVYSPSAAEIAAGSATLTLTTTGNGNCSPVSDNIVITITPAPVVNAGAGEVLCANNADIALAGSVTGATGGTWSGGSGTFTPNANDLNAVYTPSAGEIATGSLTLTLTSTGNGNCIPVTDNVTYNFSPAPTANAGADQIACANNANITLNGSVTVATGGAWSGGTGTFTPNANTLNAVYTPSAADIAAGTVTLTLTTTGNGDCLPVSDNVVINFTPAPTASAGSDQTVCANNAVVSLNGSVTIAAGGTWSGGSGVFSDANILNPTYTPSAAEIAAGTVTLTLTTTGVGDCNPVSDNVVITITPAPMVDAGIGSELCSNNPNISLNGSVSIATGGTWSGGSGTFTPNANTLNAVYTPSAGEITAGTLTLTLTSTGNGNCIPVSDNVTYTFGPAPTADAGEDFEVCSNNADAPLSGVVTVAAGGAWSGGLGVFSPNANTLDAVYTPTATEIALGSVVLTLTTTGNGDCLPESDDIEISFSTAPTADAGEDQTVCANDPDVSLDGAITIATGGTWSGGAGTFSPDASTLDAVYTPTAAEIAAGGITLTLTTTGNDDCNAVSDEVAISITPAPTVEAGIGAEVCSNNPEIALNGSVTIATGGTWSGGSGSFVPNANALNAVYTPSPAEISAGSVTLTLTSTGNDNCLAVSDEVTYTFGPSPTADAGANIVVCANNATAQLAGATTVAAGGTWSGGLGTFTPNANDLNAEYTPTAEEIAVGSLILTLTTTGNGGCLPVSDEVEIDFTPAPTANAGIDQTVCENDPQVVLTGFVTVATQGSWSGGSGTFTPDANSLNATYLPSAAEIAAGTVTLTLTTVDNGDCLAVSDQMTITIDPAPIVSAGVDQDVCSNNANVSLSGVIQNATGGVWSGGLGTFNPDNTTLDAVYTPSPAEIAGGSITLTLTSTGNGNCLAESDAIVINFTPAPTVSAGDDQTLCASTPNAQLDGTFTVASGAQWTGGAGSFAPSATDTNAVYTPTAAEIAAGSVTLTLTTTGNADCIAVADEVTLFFDPIPTVTAGADLISCANNPTVELEGGFTNADGVQWTGGTGFFNPNNQTPNAIYTPSPAEIINGSINLTIQSVGTGVCPQVSDLMTITITPAPVVNAGADQEVCANNSTVQLSGSVQFAAGGQWSGGAGSFTPTNNSLTASYQPTAAEIAAGSVTLTLTSLGNGDCDPVSDQVTITFTPAPVIDAGVDQSICENNSDVQLAGSFTVADGANWSGGAGSFSPDNTSPNAVYTPSSSELSNGSVTLTYTTFGNGNCVPVSDQMTITFTPAPVVEAGEDFFACVDDLTVPLSGQISGGSITGTWSTDGTGVFVPNASTLNASYIASSQDSLIGEVTLTLTSTNNGNCTPVTDQLTVFILPAGTADAGPDQLICENNANISLSGSIGGAATEGFWSSTGTGVFLPNNTGTNVNYIPSDEDLASGSLTFTFEVNSCNQAEDEMVVTFTPAPQVDAGEDVTVCSSESSITLDGTVSGANNTGLWTTNGTGTFSPNANDLNAEYIFSAGDVTNQIIEIYLTSTDIGNCTAVTDTLILEIFPQGSVNVGGDLETCDNAPNANVSATINGGDQILWSTTGTGSFVPNNTTISATYVPSAADLLNGSVNLTATVTNSCNLASDFLVLTFIDGPQANAGEDLAVCGTVIPFTINGSVNNATGGQWSTTGSGTFQNNSDLSTFYVASQGDIDNGGVSLVLTTTGNGLCSADSDTLFIDINTGIEVEAGPNQVVCSEAGNAQLFGQVSQGTSTGIWTTSGDGTFSPSAESLNAVYNFTQNDIDAGSVTLTLTSTNNGICDEVSDSFELSFGDGAFVFAGEDTEVCETVELVPVNGVVNGDSNTGEWSTSGTGAFQPSNTSLNAFYNPSQADIEAGSIELTLTSTNSVLCNESSATITLTFQPLPTADAGADAVICGSINGVQLLGSVQGAGGGVWSTSGSGSFLPNDSVLTAIYIPSVADSIAGGATLTLTSFENGLCAAASDQMEVTFSDAISVSAGADFDVCESDATVQLNGLVDGSANFNWSTSGEGSFAPQSDVLNPVYGLTPSDLENGQVTFFLTAQGNGTCPAVSDSVVVTIDQTPLAEIIADAAVCTTSPEFELNADVSNADTFEWSSAGAGTFSPDNTTDDVVYTPSAAEIAAGTASITLTATSIGSCGTVSSELDVQFTSPAIVNAGVDQTLCSTEESVQLAGASSTGAAIWSTTSFGSFVPGSTDLNAVYVFGENDILVGFAEVIITSDENGPCEAVTDTVEFTINPAPIVDAGADQFVCETEGLLLLSGSAENFEDVQWTTEGDGIFLNTGDPLAPEYIFGNADILNEQVEIVLTAVGLDGCASESDTTLITISAPLQAAFSHTNACVGSPVQFTDETEVFDGEIDGYIWNFGNGIIDNQQNPTFVFSEPGTEFVQLVVESSLGCTDTTSQVITVVEGPSAQFEVNQFRAPINFDFIFDDASTGAVQWNWNFGDGLGITQQQNPTYSYPDEGEYVVTLTVSGTTGCTDSISQSLIVEGQLVLPPRLPNSFSPNGDNINDVYFVRGGPFTQLDFRVYDNWGREIFKTTDQEIGWDGTDNGSDSPIGVYVYTIKATNFEGETFDYSGRINLFR
jgi:gliding motility-associated-like protein